MKQNIFQYGRVYVKGGIGNKLYCEYNGVPFRAVAPFDRLAVFAEVRHGITSVKDLRVEHMYELLDYLKELGFADATIKSYMAAFRKIYSRKKHLFADDFEMPSNTGYEQWTKEKQQNG